MPFSTYLPEHMGTISLAAPGPFVAGKEREDIDRLAGDELFLMRGRQGGAL